MRMILRPFWMTLLLVIHSSTQLFAQGSREPISLTVQAHETIKQIRITPDSTRAVSSSYGSKLYLWDLMSGRLIRAIQVADSGKSVGTFAIAPDGEHVITVPSEQTIVVTNLRNGEQRKISLEQKFAGAGWSLRRDGKLLLTAGPFLGAPQAWDIDTGRLLFTLHRPDEYTFNGKKIPGAMYGGLSATAISPDGRWIAATSNSEKKPPSLFDGGNGRFARDLQSGIGSGGLSKLQFTQNGRHLLEVFEDKGPSQTLRIWDFEKREILHTLHDGFVAKYRRHYLLTGANLMLTYLSEADNNRFVLWDVASGKKIREFEALDEDAFALNSAKDIIVLANRNFSGLYAARLGNGEVITQQAARATRLPLPTQLSPSRILLNNIGKQSLVLDISKGVIALDNMDCYPGPPTRQNPIGVAFCGKENNTYVSLIDGALSRELARVSPMGSSSWSWRYTGSHVVGLFWGDDHKTSVMKWPIASPATAVSQTLSVQDTSDPQAYVSPENALSPDGELYAATENYTGFLDLVHVWSTETGRQVFALRDPQPIQNFKAKYKEKELVRTHSSIRGVRFVDKGKLIVTFGRDELKLPTYKPQIGQSGPPVQYANNIRLWDKSSGRLTRTIPTGDFEIKDVIDFGQPRSILVLSENGSVQVVDLDSGRVLRRSAPLANAADKIALSADSKLLFIETSESVLYLVRVATFDVVARVLVSERGDWLVITPAGFFAASANGGDLLGIGRGFQVTSVDQVYEALYRPDLVEHLLRGDREGQYKDAAHKLNLETILDSGPAPQIEHISERDERAGDTIRLSVRITGTGGGVGSKIVWRVNGITQGNSAPTALASPTAPLTSIVVTETLKVPNGQTNLVEVVAYNAAGLVATPPYHITVDRFGATAGNRPRMFVLAVGVDKYRMKEYQLAYAAHDARSFAKALEAVGSALFSDVHVKTLTDQEVTEAGVAAAIEEIGRQAQPEDVFVLFLGGHGKSIAGRYYYYPQTLDFAGGHTVEQGALGQDKWEAWLAKLTVQKSLLIIDTCEGDAFRGSRGSESGRQTAMDQLQRATGRNIIAASRDAAYEGYQGHGVLTYALLEALDKTASGGTDDRVRVAALADYVGVRVPEISQKNFGIYQSPTRKLTGNDFPIGIRQVVLTTTNNGPEIRKEPTHVLIRSELSREKPELDAPGGQTLNAGTQVRAVEFVGAWVIVARDGQKLGYVPIEALARIQ